MLFPRWRWSCEECATPSLLPVEAQSVRFQCNRARWPIGRIGRKRPLRGLGGVGRRTGRQRAGPDHSERTTPRPGSWVAPGIWPKLKLTRSVNLLLPHSRRSPSAPVAWSEPALCHRTAFPAKGAKPGTYNGANWRRSRSLPSTVSPTTQKTKTALRGPGRLVGSRPGAALRPVANKLSARLSSHRPAHTSHSAPFLSQEVYT